MLESAFITVWGWIYKFVSAFLIFMSIAWGLLYVSSYTIAGMQLDRAMTDVEEHFVKNGNITEEQVIDYVNNRLARNICYKGCEIKEFKNEQTYIGAPLYVDVSITIKTVWMTFHKKGHADFASSAEYGKGYLTINQYGMYND